MYWLRGKDLNLRPLGYEPNELPGCSTPQCKYTAGERAGQSICAPASCAAASDETGEGNDAKGGTRGWECSEGRQKSVARA